MSTLLPYPGLRPFFRDETDIFFGREEHTDDLLEILSRSHFLAVLGPSGCGKSSLVRAGMLPALETGFIAAAGARWRVAEMRPGDHPLQRLAAALIEESALGRERRGEADAEAFLYATLRRGPLGLLEVLRETPLPERTNLLVFVDQFEEIFRFRDHGATNRDEADAFVALLLETAQQREVPAYVAITMRSDYLGHCAVFAELPEAMNSSQYLTPRLTREQRQSAIVGPARVFAADVEPALVNRLLNDMGSDPNQLPLMQHVLMRMWQGSSDEAVADAGHRTVTLSDYLATKGLTMALSDHADEAWNELESDEKRRIAEVLFRCLTERGADQRDTRRPTPLQEIADVAGVSTAQVAQVVEAFRREDRSFLTPRVGERLFPSTRLDITHESLISNWRRLNRWAQAEAKSAETYRLLEQSARRWKAGKTALWGTPDLEHALSWKDSENPSPAWAARYGGNYELALEFLAESEKRHRANQMEAEALRQRELQQARSLAEAQEQRAETERLRAQEATASNQRLRRLSWGLAVVVVLAFLTALVAVGWRNSAVVSAGRAAAADKQAAEALLQKQAAEAEKQAAEAEKELSTVSANAARDRERAAIELAKTESDLQARELERQSQESFTRAVLLSAANVDNDPELSLALAVQAASGSQAVTPEVRDALHAAVTSSRLTLSIRDPASLLTAVAYSPDGTRIATGNSLGVVRIWDSRSGRALRTYFGHSAAISAVTYAPSGTLLASSSDDGTAVVWDTAAAGKRHLLAAHTDELSDVAFSPDGTRIATASKDGAVVLWDARTAKQLRVFDHVDEVQQLSFHPDGRRLATATTSGSIRLWNLDSGQLIKDFRPSENDIFTIAFSPDGGRLAIAYTGGMVITVNASSGERLHSFVGHTNSVFELAFDRAGTRLVTAGYDGTARVWNATGGGELFHLAVQRNAAQLALGVRGVDFSPDGGHLATIHNDRIEVWTTETGGETGTFTGHTAAVRDIAYSPNGELLASASRDRTARIWNVSTGALVRALEPGQIVEAVAFSPDGRTLATAGRNGDTQLWDVASGKTTGTIDRRDARTTGVAFSPDGKSIATTGEDSTARIVEIASGRLIRTLPNPEARGMYRVAFNPKGTLLATAGGSGSATVWDVATGGRKFELRHRVSLDIMDVAFSPDGRYIATGSEDRFAIVWDAATGAEVRTLAGHADVVSSVAFSPDGTELSTATADGIRIWDVASWRQVRQLVGNTESVNAVAYSPNGRTLAGADTVVREYTRRTDDLLDLARGRLVRPLAAAECQKYLGRSSCPPSAAGLILQGQEEVLATRFDAALATLRKAQSLQPRVPLDPQQEQDRWRAGLALRTAITLAREMNEPTVEQLDTVAKLLRAADSWDATFEIDSIEDEIAGLLANLARARGMTLARSGDLKAATAAFQRAARLDISVRPNPSAYATRVAARELVRRGVELRDADQLPAARDLLLRATALDPDYDIAPGLLAGVYMSLGQFDDAIGHLEKQIDRNASNDVWCLLAEAHLGNGDFDRAATAVKAALALEPEYAPARALMATVHERLGNYEESANHLRTAITLDPDLVWLLRSADLHMKIAQMAADERSRALNESLAQERLRTAARIAPSGQEAYVLLGLRRYNARDWDGAMAAFKRVDPKGAYREITVPRMASMYHERMFAFEQAYEVFREIVDAGSRDSGDLANLAEANLATRRFDDAYRLASEITSQAGASQVSPGTQMAMRFVMVCARVMQGRSADASAALDDLLAYYSRNLTGYEPGWSYAGTRQFVRRSALGQPAKDGLLALIDMLSDPSRKASPETLRRLIK